MQQITIKDVAKRAGVSVTSVSRVLNNRGYISVQLREKVMDAIEELDYTPNEIARSFYKNETKDIALIIPTTLNPFFSELTFYVEKELANLGYHLYVCNSLNDPSKEKEYLKMLSEKKVDGIIVGSHDMDIKEYDKIKGNIVSFERKINDSIPMIVSDNYLGGKLATEELVRKECQTIVCITGDQDEGTPANNRVVAYSDVVKKNNLKEHIYRIPFTDTREEKIEKIKNIFKEDMKVEGVFAGDDLTAHYVMQVTKALGYKIQDDLHIVGFDGTNLMRDLSPEIITVIQPLEQMATKAVQTLLSLIEGEEVRKEYTFSVELSE